MLAIVAFAFYYLRAKRFDHFHKVELEKQLRRAHEEQVEREQGQPHQEENKEERPEEKNDPDQPVIV